MIKNITVEEIERQFFKYHLSQVGLSEIEVSMLNSYLYLIEDWREKPTQSNRHLFSFDSEKEGNEGALFGLKTTFQELEEKGMIEIETLNDGLRVNISPYVLKIYAIAEQLQKEWSIFFRENVSSYTDQTKTEAVRVSAMHYLEENYEHLLKFRRLVNEFDFNKSDSIDTPWSL
ncbi:MAG: hypothetical protein AAF549_03120 [Pseudomonadota bacterium]